MAVEDGGKAEKPQEGERRRNLQVVVVKRIIQLGKGDYITVSLMHIRLSHMGKAKVYGKS